MASLGDVPPAEAEGLGAVAAEADDAMIEEEVGMKSDPQKGKSWAESVQLSQ